MLAPDPGSRQSRLVLVALGLALIGAASMLYYHLGLFMPRVLQVSAARGLGGGYSFGNDFYPVWLTSHEWLGQRRYPYSIEMTREIQQGLFGRALDPHNPSDPLIDYRTFAYPAFTDLLFWPASRLPFPALRVVLAATLAVLTLASVMLWMHALGWRPGSVWIAIVIPLALCSYPVLEGLYACQLGLFVGFFLAASLFALQRKHLLLSGVLIALTTIKPQMTLLAIFYLTLWSMQRWGERRRFCMGFFLTSTALVCMALIVWPHWIQSWLQVVVGYHRYATPPLVNEVLAAPLGPGAAGPAALFLTVVSLIAAVALAWKNRNAAPDSREFRLTLSLLLAITVVTLLPGQAIHDHVILLPAVFLLASSWHELFSNRVVRILLALGAAVLVWPWLAAFSVIVLHPLLTHEQFYSKAVFALPLRTAAVFPFVVLALLVSARRVDSALPAR